MLEINLKELIKSYDQHLLDNLRGFGREDEFLKFYVPGTNEYQSFLNLVDALVETEILSFKVIFEVADGKNSLTEEIKTFLSKISKFDIEKDKSFERVSIEININKYKNSQINRRNQSKEVIKQKIDNTKHVAIFGINENIKIEYKENLRLFNPKSFYKENFLEDENIFTHLHRHNYFQNKLFQLDLLQQHYLLLYIQTKDLVLIEIRILEEPMFLLIFL